MKRFLILSLFLTAFACTNEPEVRPTNLSDKILLSKEESSKFEDRGRDGDGCLAGSPAGYCCNWGGQVVICVKK